MFQWTDQPFIQDQQVNLTVCFDYFLECAGSFRYTQFFQKCRETDVADCLKFAAGCIPKGACDVGFPSSAGAAQDDVVPFINIFAGGETQDLRFIQFSVRMVLNRFNGSAAL